MAWFNRAFVPPGLYTGMLTRPQPYEAEAVTHEAEARTHEAEAKAKTHEAEARTHEAEAKFMRRQRFEKPKNL